MNKTHGLAKKYPSEWNSWRAAKGRCYYKPYRKFDLYGGRGITICDRWRGVDGFYYFIQDMGSKPTKKHSLDRIDNDKGYSPDNCRWASQTEQVHNSSTVQYLEIDGVTDIVTNHIKRSSISTTLYYKRVKKGMTPIEALTTPNTGIADQIVRKKAKAMAKRRNCIGCQKICRLHKNFCGVICSNKYRHLLEK